MGTAGSRPCTSAPVRATFLWAPRLESAPARFSSRSASHSRADAEEVARTSLQKGAGAVRQSFERAWRAQPEIPPALGKVSGDDGMLARASFALLHCLEDKSHAGAFIAAPAAPWGEHNHDGNPVYHLIRPRELGRIAT